MHSISRPTTNVDRQGANRSSTGTVSADLPGAHLTVAVRPVTEKTRTAHPGIPAAARFVVIAHAGRREFLWLTDADPGIGNLVCAARGMTRDAGARFVEPDATCEWCGSPVAGDERFCPAGPSRDCESAWRVSDYRHVAATS